MVCLHAPSLSLKTEKENLPPNILPIQTKQNKSQIPIPLPENRQIRWRGRGGRTSIKRKGDRQMLLGEIFSSLSSLPLERRRQDGGSGEWWAGTDILGEGDAGTPFCTSSHLMPLCLILPTNLKQFKFKTKIPFHSISILDSLFHSIPIIWSSFIINAFLYSSVQEGWKDIGDLFHLCRTPGFTPYSTETPSLWEGACVNPGGNLPSRQLLT